MPYLKHILLAAILLTRTEITRIRSIYWRICRLCWHHDAYIYTTQSTFLCSIYSLQRSFSHVLKSHELDHYIDGFVGYVGITMPTFTRHNLHSYVTSMTASSSPTFAFVQSLTYSHLTPHVNNVLVIRTQINTAGSYPWVTDSHISLSSSSASFFFICVLRRVY